MRLYCKKYGFDIELSDIEPTTIVIENTKLYAEICNDIWIQSNGGDGNIVFANNKELKISKDVAVIFNPFAVNCNDKKIISKLYKEISDIAEEIYYEESSKLLSQIVNYLDLLTTKIHYPLKYDFELDKEGLYKLFAVSIEEDSLNLLEKIANYIKMLNRVTNISVVITVGLKRFLDNDELKELYKEIAYEKIYLCNFENCYDCKITDEQVIIYDNDLCQINLS